MAVSSYRQCSRTACSREAVATLTYVYSDSTAVLGPLAVSAEPHSYDLCQAHASRLTAPRGWEVVRVSVPGSAVQSDVAVGSKSAADAAADALDASNAVLDGSLDGTLSGVDAAGSEPAMRVGRLSSLVSLSEPYDELLGGAAPTRRSLASLASESSERGAEVDEFEQRKIEISKPLTQPDDDWSAIADVVRIEEKPVSPVPPVPSGTAGSAGNVRAVTPPVPLAPESFIPPESLMRPRHAAEPEAVQQGEVARRGHLRMLRDDS